MKSIIEWDSRINGDTNRWKSSSRSIRLVLTEFLQEDLLLSIEGEEKVNVLTTAAVICLLFRLSDGQENLFSVFYRCNRLLVCLSRQQDGVFSLPLHRSEAKAKCFSSDCYWWIALVFRQALTKFKNVFDGFTSSAVQPFSFLSSRFFSKWY